MTRTKRYDQQDGARYLSETGPVQDFWPVATIMPAYKFRFAGGNSHPVHHFLRFKFYVPHQYVTIKQAYLTLTWSPNKNYEIGYYKRSAHFDGDGCILISVINKTVDIDDAATAKAQQLLAEDYVWDDPRLKLNDRFYDVPINSESFHSALNALIASKGSAFNDLYIFLCPYNFTKFEDVGWNFKSKESIRYIEGEPDQVPVLTIIYDYDPILPDADETLDQTMSMYQQFEIVGFDFDLEQSIQHLQEFEFFPNYEFTLTQNQILQQEFTELYDQTLEQRLISNQDFTILKDYTLDQTLTITQQFEDYRETLDQTMDIDQEFILNYYILDQTVDHEQEFQLEAILDGKFVEQGIAIEQEFTLTTGLSFTLDQTVTPEQFLSGVFYDSGGNVIPSYSSEQCDITLINDSQTQIFLNPITTLTLEYPHEDIPSHTLILRTPIFGNQEEIRKQRIQRRTTGGKLITFMEAGWADDEIFRMGFEYLEDNLRDQIIDFIDASLGKKVKLIDHESRTWIGIITNPNGELLRTADVCGDTFEFEFRVL